MARFFNTAGGCEPRKHYMLPPSERLPSLGSLIDREAYFVVHAPRTTTLTARSTSSPTVRAVSQLASCAA